MKRENLKVDKRTVTGKKVVKLRRDGIVPGNVYGKGIKSVAVQLPLDTFMAVFKQVHETGLVDLSIAGASEALPVLIHNVQIDPRSQTPLHADFFKVNLKEKITAKIPVAAIGEPKAEIDKVGLLEQPVSEIEVEALPTDLPEKVEVNVEKLTLVDDQIVISDIKMPEGVTVLNEASQVVFKIGELVTKEMEEQMAADEAEVQASAEETAAETEAEAEKAEGKSAEGEEAPAEGETAGQESATEDSSQKSEQSEEPKKE